ncbi:unnamed protein product [Chrysoparadoxa australica]
MECIGPRRTLKRATTEPTPRVLQRSRPQRKALASLSSGLKGKGSKVTAQAGEESGQRMATMEHRSLKRARSNPEGSPPGQTGAGAEVTAAAPLAPSSSEEKPEKPRPEEDRSLPRGDEGAASDGLNGHGLKGKHSEQAKLTTTFLERYAPASRPWLHRGMARLLGGRLAKPLRVRTYAKSLVPSAVWIGLVAGGAAGERVEEANGGVLDGYGVAARMKAVTCIAFDSEGALVAVGTEGGLLAVYDFDEWQYVHRAERLKHCGAWAGEEDGEGALEHDLQSCKRKYLQPVATKWTSCSISCVAWHPDHADYVAVAFKHSPEVVVFDIDGGGTKTTYAVSNARGAGIRSMAFTRLEQKLRHCSSSNSKGTLLLLTGSSKGTVTVWQSSSKKLCREPLYALRVWGHSAANTLHEQSVTALCCLPSGLLAAGSSRGTLTVWDMHKLRQPTLSMGMAFPQPVMVKGVTLDEPATWLEPSSCHGDSVIAVGQPVSGVCLVDCGDSGRVGSHLARRPIRHHGFPERSVCCLLGGLQGACAVVRRRPCNGSLLLCLVDLAPAGSVALGQSWVKTSAKGFSTSTTNSYDFCLPGGLLVAQQGEAAIQLSHAGRQHLCKRGRARDGKKTSKLCIAGQLYVVEDLPEDGSVVLDRPYQGPAAPVPVFASLRAHFQEQVASMPYGSAVGHERALVVAEMNRLPWHATYADATTICCHQATGILVLGTEDGGITVIKPGQS